MDSSNEADKLRRRIEALGPWFHNLDLRGVPTAPDHPLGNYPGDKWARFSAALDGKVAGRTVLDIGCNGGFYAIEMKRLGAARVVGIDHDEDYLAQARFAAEQSGVDVELRHLSVHDVALLGERFDIVLFMGVLYHLRHPLLALDLIHEHVASDVLVFQSMLRGSPEPMVVEPDYPITRADQFSAPGYPLLHFIEHCYAGDPTNWWVPNRSCAQAMLRSAGFVIESQPEEEVFICRRGEAATSGAVYPARGPR